MPGRADNYEKYFETLVEWHRDGWCVTAADWRGQGGSGRLGSDTVTGHIDDFATWVHDFAEFWHQWIEEAPPPHVIVAHSMGGHIILRALVDGLITPDATVLSAPMLAVKGPPIPPVLVHALAKLMVRVGDPARPAWKWSDEPGKLPEGRDELLTHDADRYMDESWWRERRPELVMGPSSWGWLERAYASTRMLFKPGALEAVTSPLLIVSTSNDQLVSHQANVSAAGRLPCAQLITFGEEARHEILREVDPVRRRMMDAISAFLDEVAPPLTSAKSRNDVNPPHGQGES